MVMLPLRDVMGSLCQNLTILLPVRERRTLAHRHPRPHRCWAPEVEPLPVGVKPLPRAWHWLAGASVAVPPGFTVLTHLSGNWHGSLLIVTACMYASRTIPGPLNKLSTAVSRWLFFLPTQYYFFIFLGYATHVRFPLKHSWTTGRELPFPTNFKRLESI